MIRHIVSWQLSEADPARKAAHAAEIAARLEALVGVVDEIRALRVGADVAGGANWDVVLVADFDDLDAVGRYQVHPAHQAAGAFIRSVVSDRMAVDIIV
ncbi:Dabb family protein [Cryobacterium cryoconiti]|uniref:Dabb family protein n=1 Tax=Cryobacterium cryoconiti TaxID=1259239 RepID=A0A4Y8JVD9_9MICO|nr:Dabb family protein [Cryobacterium cryoconiti]TFD31565.1 Dabb family protein [Cryobacterium cryoconiti]